MNTRMTLATTTAMALGLAFLAVPAVAQDTQPTQYLGRVILGYSADGTPVYAGENQTVLEGTSVTAQGGAAKIDEVLRQTPGVQTTASEAGQPGVAVSIRGMEGSGRVSMEVEGVPQNYRYNPAAGDTESYAYVEPAFVTGIEVNRGAVVTTGGSGLAGSVNFRLLSAQDVVDGEGFGGLARLSYGSLGDDVTRTLATGYVKGPFSALAAITKRGADAYEDGEGNDVGSSDRDSDAYMLRFGYELADNQALDLVAAHNEAQFTANNYFQNETVDLVKLGYKLHLNDQVDLNINAYYTSTETENLRGGLYVGRKYEVTTTGVNLSNVSRFGLGDVDLTSTNGFEYNRDRIGGVAGGLTPTSGRGERLSIFTENVFAFSSGWELTAALRANQYKLSGHYAGQAGSPVPAQDVSLNDKEVDPKLTLAYQVNEWLQPYVSVYRTSRAPTVQETLMDVMRDYSMYGLGVYYWVANPDLRTETSETAEIGFNVQREGLFTSNDSLRARVSYFSMDVKDYILNTTLDEAERINTYVNIPGTTRSKGLELEASYDSEKLSAVLSFTQSSADIPDGSDYDLQPERTVGATLAGHFLQGALTAGASYTYTSGGVSYDTKDPTESYELVDVFASYRVSDNFAVTAKVSNIFDEVYVPWGMADNSNGPGRAAFIGGEVRF